MADRLAADRLAAGELSLNASRESVSAARESPLPNRSNIYVNELRDGIISDSARVKGKCNVAKLLGIDTRDPDVDGFRKHMLAMLGDAGNR